MSGEDPDRVVLAGVTERQLPSWSFRWVGRADLSAGCSREGSARETCRMGGACHPWQGKESLRLCGERLGRSSQEPWGSPARGHPPLSHWLGTTWKSMALA